MPYHLIIKEEARLDMLHAYQYYELQQAGLGERFLNKLEERFSALAAHPEYYSYMIAKTF